MNIVSKEQAAAICIEHGLISGFFSKPVKKDSSIQKIKLRKILLKNQEQYQLECFDGTKVFHKNLLPQSLQEKLEDLFFEFKIAEFASLNSQLIFLQNNKGDIHFKTKAIKKSPLNKEHVSSIENLEHNKQKEYILNTSEMPIFLKKLNFFTDEGKIIQSKYHKFRQINKYLEFIKSVLPELKDILKEKKELHIADFGCGKAYLSFALYYYLTEIEKLPVKICGLDLKEDVIDFYNKIRQECGFKNLIFEVGDIGRFKFDTPPDMVISLHACDTATDLAIAKAVKSDAKIIFAVPCCQHEFNTQIRKNKSNIIKSFSPMLDYGIITEKFTSLLTDTVRGKLLETCGYKVSVEEFIETEHTPKNILIKAVKLDDKSKSKTILIEKAKQEFKEIKQAFLIKPCLEKLLNEK
ncbi:class I SAM-dependent methyltransferase [Treponema putidum]|uniref:class I SAM-dependent methyltransferase n=1 Tax=Treponema putidum TaxID=221027 RepID=UPI003D907782